MALVHEEEIKVIQPIQEQEKLKASEALIANPMKLKQSFQFLIDFEPFHKNSYCAIGLLGKNLGMDDDALGDIDYEHYQTKILKQYGVNGRQRYACPEHSSWTSMSLAELIPHLNDTHCWTYEKIGTFLSTLGY